MIVLTESDFLFSNYNSHNYALHCSTPHPGPLPYSFSSFCISIIAFIFVLIFFPFTLQTRSSSSLSDTAYFNFPWTFTFLFILFLHLHPVFSICHICCSSLYLFHLLSLLYISTSPSPPRILILLSSPPSVPVIDGFFSLMFVLSNGFILYLWKQVDA